MSIIIKSEILFDEDDLLVFQQKAFEKIGVHFPISYLKQGIVRGFRDKKNNLVGGYALIKDGPLRTVESLPCQSLLKYNPDELFEVTALWLERSFKSGLISCKFWLNFCRDIYSQFDKKYFIYAYDLHNKKLQKIYKNANPDIVYRGKVKKLVGNEYAGVESIELACRKSLILTPFRSFPKFIEKALKGRNISPAQQEISIPKSSPVLHGEIGKH